MAVTDLDLGKYKLGWSDEEDYVFKPKTVSYTHLTLPTIYSV